MDNEWTHLQDIRNTCGPRLLGFFAVYSTDSPHTQRGQADTQDTHTHKHMLAQVLINEPSCGMASAPGAPLDGLHPTHFP